ncbi:13362_t:CDS:1, partial [Dentiscutata heterogama]
MQTNDKNINLKERSEKRIYHVETIKPPCQLIYEKTNLENKGLISAD